MLLLFILPSAFSVRTAAAAAAVTVITVFLRVMAEECSFRCKDVGGKGHLAECRASILAVGIAAFLVGHAVVARLYKKLCGTLDTNDREDPDADKELTGRLVYKRSVEMLKDRIRDNDVIAAVRVVVAAARAGTLYVYRENKGRSRLNDRDRETRGNTAVCEHFANATAGRRTVRADIALAAVENHALFKNGKTAEFLRCTHTVTRLQCQHNVGFDRNTVKAAIKGHGIHADVRP